MFHPNGVGAVVLNHDEDRQQAIPVGIYFAEGIVGLLVRFHRFGRDGDLFAGLAVWIIEGGLCLEWRSYRRLPKLQPLYSQAGAAAIFKALKRKAIFLLYRVLQAFASPVILALSAVGRGLRNPRYFGTLVGALRASCPLAWQQTVSAAIWFHAVSVGEVLAAIPLIEEVRRRTPSTPVFVSTTTLAGRETATKRLAGISNGVFFAPFDFVWVVRRVLRHCGPAVVVILETEIWPNLFREAKSIGCGLVLVNGRISDRALPRYRKLCAGILAGAFAVRQDTGPVGGNADAVRNCRRRRLKPFRWAGI